MYSTRLSRNTHFSLGYFSKYSKIEELKTSRINIAENPFFKQVQLFAGTPLPLKAQVSKLNIKPHVGGAGVIMTPAEEWSLSKRKWWETEKCEGSSQSTRCLCQTKKIRALKGRARHSKTISARMVVVAS